MTPEALDVLDDAIKILGPAAITGIVAYYTARIQITARLKEIEKSNEFKAREHFFKHQRDRQTSADAAARGILSSLQQLLARDPSTLSAGEYVHIDLMRKQSLAGFEIGKQAMDVRGLTDKRQFKDLVAAHEVVTQHPLPGKGNVTKQDLSNLWELVRLWDLCTDLVAEHDLNAWFGKYFA